MGWNVVCHLVLGVTIGFVGDDSVRLKEPVESRVYQRGTDDRADIPIIIDKAPEGARVVSATIGGTAPISTKFADGKLVGVPTGGPYLIQCQLEWPNGTTSTSVQRVYVGDLWVLAGQSNMEGVGDLADVTPPNDRVRLLGMDGNWSRAEEPLHWLVDSPDPVHSGDPADREARSQGAHKTRRKGAGLGLPFGVAMLSATNVPVGLVACAHGGTSMAQWDPAKKGDGGKSLYGSMLRQVGLAGGKVRGVLWYQGESDAFSGASDAYPKTMSDFIAAVRSDFGQPDLPFYLVQIGRFIGTGNIKGWNAIQDAQRLIPARIPNTAVVSVIDLELDDLIHVGTQGLKRTGLRLARIAERELFGQIGATTPTLDQVMRGSNNTIIVKFKGVNRGPSPQDTAGAVAGRVALRGPGGGSGSGNAGLLPVRHIAGFSIRKADGSEIPLIFEAAVGTSKDAVVLKLTGPVPEGAQLWYGWGFDPYCNLTDAFDMAVPVFGPIPLDDVK